MEARRRRVGTAAVQNDCVFRIYLKEEAPSGNYREQNNKFVFASAMICYCLATVMGKAKKTKISQVKPGKNRRGEPVTLKMPNFLAEQKERLRQALPQIFSEGKVDLEKLQSCLAESIDERQERYSFTWAGKRQSILELQKPTWGTLVPAKGESINFDTTENVFIEGENLEVLRLLYKSYFGRVKMIYIDPPYNTGSEFVYPDNFADPKDAYLRVTGQKDAEGNLLTSNPESSGRYHSAWLSMMYPRLFLARQLLRDDGVIFVSIDDHEVHNLRLLMNEIFGEENYLTTIAWQRRDTPANDVQGYSTYHEYALCYAKQIEMVTVGLVPRTQEQINIYKNPDNDPRGVWTRNALTRPGSSEKDCYPIKNPKGRLIYPPKGTSWRVSRATLNRLTEDNRLWWGSTGDGDMPFQKRFLSEVKDGVVPTTWWDYKFAGSMRNAKTELREIFADDPPFDYPKPSSLIQRMVEISTAKSDGDIILDFFAGSGTTAQAVLELNAKDGGNRQFLLVQLPEPLSRKDFSTIAEVTKERIRRVSETIVKAQTKKQKEEDLELKFEQSKPNRKRDLGFAVFKLTPSNFKPWVNEQDATPEKLAIAMELFNDPLAEGWKPENVIYEVAIKEGFSLAVRVEKIPAARANRIFQVTDVEQGQSFRICLDDELKAATVKELNLKKDDLFICRDMAIDDKMAANLALQCRLKTI